MCAIGEVVGFEDEYTCVVHSTEELNVGDLLKAFIKPEIGVDKKGNRKEFGGELLPVLKVDSQIKNNEYRCKADNSGIITRNINEVASVFHSPNICVNDPVKKYKK